VNSVLLFMILCRMTQQLWPSAVVAALFALHPLRVESVAWITGRKDVLSGLFFMLTLLAYSWYVERRSVWRYLFVLSAFVLGLLSKPILVTVPFLLLLLDLWPLKRWNPNELPSKILLLEKLPLLVLSAISCLVTVLAQRAAGAISGLETISPVWRGVNALVAYVIYLAKSIWPTNLAVFYPHPAHDMDQQFSTWLRMGIVAVLLLAAVTVLVISLARRWPFLAVGWLWYLGMLVPVIGLFQVGAQSWADRFSYLPLIGFYVMLAWGLYYLKTSRPKTRLAFSGLLCCALVALAVSARNQVAHWKDSKTLFEHALAVTENNAVAHNNQGIVLSDRGRFEEAVSHYQESLRIRPATPGVHINLGTTP